jgi:hypothetical protein
MAFSDDMIRGVVKTGQYSDPAAEKHLASVLIKRRDKIGRYYMTRSNPLVDFSLDSSATLTFANAAVKCGIGTEPGAYAASWSTYENGTGATRPIGETKGSAGQLPGPSGLPSAPGSYILVEVRAVDAPHPSWNQPVKVYFRRVGAGWKLVGVERMPDQEPKDAVALQASKK